MNQPLTKTQGPHSREAVLALIDVVADDLLIAIMSYEVFAPSAKDQSLLDRVNASEIHGGFNVVSEALQLNVISALCRIWDSTKDAAGVPQARKRLRKLRWLAIDQDALNAWEKNVETVERSEEFRAIRGFRGVGQAHRHDPSRPEERLLHGARPVAHGDERKLLEKTITVVEDLYRLLGLKDRQDFAKRCEAWRDRSEKFWRSIG